MYEILINIATQQLCVESNQSQEIVACYPIAVGKASTPTPLGHFGIERIVKDPSYVGCKTGKNYGKGFLGDYAITTSLTTAEGCAMAIHGTNIEASVGRRVTGGCTRMRARDLKHFVNNYLLYSTGGRVING